MKISFVQRRVLSLIGVRGDKEEMRVGPAELVGNQQVRIAHFANFKTSGADVTPFTRLLLRPRVAFRDGILKSWFL